MAPRIGAAKKDTPKPGQLVTLTAKEAYRLGFSETTARDVTQLRRHLGLSAAVWKDGKDLFSPVRLTDAGETHGWLMDVQINPRTSAKRQAFVEDVLRIYGVEQEGLELFIDLGPSDEPFSKVVALGQSCVRVADLLFTKR